MKKYILLVLSIIAFQLNTRAQNCSNFCVLAIANVDTTGVNTVDVTIYNGDTNQVNYPTVVVINSIGDTVANKVDFYDLFVMVAGDTTMITIPTDWSSLPVGFIGTVTLYDRITLTTCTFPYPMPCTVGINEILANQNTWSVFPNPATADIHVLFNEWNGSSSEITLYDSTGKKVRMVTSSSDGVFIERGDLAKGLYFISVLNGDKQLTKKIILE
jgi:Secretion system C-terminal sorting domain